MGFNVYFEPGQKFEDYYKTIGKNKQLTLGGIFEKDSEELALFEKNNDNAIRIVHYFHKSIHGNEKKYTKKELGQANNLFEKYGNEQTWHILRFAISKMHHINFKPDYFGAILKYVDDGVEDYRIQKAIKEQQRREKEQQHNARVAEYKKWLSQTPEERVQPFLNMYITKIRQFEKREPDSAEIEDRRKELMAKEPTPERKQEILFGKLI